jgi:metallophosphoesterase superfamily enzyme
MNSQPLEPLDRRWIARKVDGEKVLIISDLHLGFEIEWFGRGLKTNVPNWSYEIINKLKSDISKINPDHLIICGDLEHRYSIRETTNQKKTIDIPEDLKNLIIQKFNTEIIQIPNVESYLVLGENDDQWYQELDDKCRILPSEGLALFDHRLGVFHGHKFPFREIVFTNEIFCGHVHPSVVIKDELNIKHEIPIFTKLSLSREDLFLLFNFPFELEEIGMIETVPITVLPAYNHYLPSYSLNKIDGGKKIHKPFPFLKAILRHPNLMVQMTDGIYLGFLSDI